MFGEIKRMMEAHRLRRQIARAIEAARGMSENGLPRGHKYYQKLLSDAMAAVERLAEIEGKTIEDILAYMPGVYELEKLAGNGPAESKGSLAVVAIAGLLGIMALLGGAAALAVYVFRMLT